MWGKNPANTAGQAIRRGPRGQDEGHGLPQDQQAALAAVSRNGGPLTSAIGKRQRSAVCADDGHDTILRSAGTIAHAAGDACPAPPDSWR